MKKQMTEELKGELYYKSVRLINGKLKLIVTDEYDNIVQNPTKEQIKTAIFDNSSNNKYKFRERICCNCGSTETIIEGSTPIWGHCKCEKIDCTMYLCNKCRMNVKNIYQKLNAQWRNGKLDPFSNVGKGFIGQQIVAKTYNVEDCNLKMDNFHFYVDLKIPGYGLVDVQARSLTREGQWLFSTRRAQEYDILFALCMDNNQPWVNVERVYAIPWEFIVNRSKTTVSITKDPSKYFRLYDKFRIDEMPFNDTYHNMKLENCKILRNL